MEIRKITQAEFDALPIVNGCKIVPDYTDLTSIKVIPDLTTIGNNCTIGKYCTIGNNCTIGNRCTISYRCTIGDNCTIGNRCTISYRCTIGDRCTIEGKKLIGSHIFSGSGFGSEARTTYGIPTADTVYIRCGCWFGSLTEFRERVKDVYEGKEYYDEYLLMANMFEAAWKIIKTQIKTERKK